MDEKQIIERLLETNEKIAQSNDRKFNILATLYILTLIGFFSYLSFGISNSEIALPTNSTFDSNIEQKVGE